MNNQEVIQKILMSEDIVQSINNNIDILLEIIPELKDMIGFQHNHPHHHLDVWNHTLFALSLSEPNFDIRLCLLLHDIGKPHSYQDDEIRHFKGHPLKSSVISRNILTRLGYDEEYINEMCYLIENHDNPMTKGDIENNYEISVKKFCIQYCDALAHHPDKLEKRIEYLKTVFEYIKQIDNNIDKKIKIKI
jgi:tRNA nucleotidyltransferase (CCA-adding enzyme)